MLKGTFFVVPRVMGTPVSSFVTFPLLMAGAIPGRFSLAEGQKRKLHPSWRADTKPHPAWCAEAQSSS